MKTKLLALFLTVAFAFSSYARPNGSYADTKVLSVATNGTEVITITETTSKSIDFYAFGMRNSATNTTTVTTNVFVSTIPSEKQIELQKEVEEYRKEQELAFKAQLKAEKERKERKEQEKKRAEAYRNAYEFLSKPISKKEEK